MKTKNYFPSNGTEFMQFQSDNCDNCYKEKQCSILRGYIVLGIEPKQWTYNQDKEPYCAAVCTSFAKQRPKAKAKAKNNPNELTLF